MSTNRWLGGAASVAQVDTITVGGAPAAGQVYSVSVPAAGGSKTVSYTAVPGDTITTIATALAALLNGTAAPLEFREIFFSVLGAIITAAASTAGKPFTLTSTATAPGALTTAVTTPSSGPNDLAILLNWSLGVLPVTGDDVFWQNSNVPVLYNLQALAAVTPNTVVIDSSCTAAIGLAFTDPAGYVQYRQRYLQFNGVTNGVTIGRGSGNGSGKIQLDTQSGACAVTLLNTAASAEQGIPSFLWKGSNAANQLNASKGSYGLAVFAGETAQVPVINHNFQTSVSSDVTGYTGPGCTLTTVTKTGGRLTMSNAPATFTQADGTSTILSGSLATAVINGGTLQYWPQNGGTIASNTVLPGAKLDFSGTQAAVILTNSTWHGGAQIVGPGGNVTMANPASVPSGHAGDVKILLGPGRKVQVL